MDVISNAYYYFADNKIYEPLDTYLDSDKYSKIKNSMPQKYWDSYKYNGKIYGVDNSFFLHYIMITDIKYPMRYLKKRSYDR